MKFEQFQSHIGRLSEVYGAKYFPQERVTLFWENIKDMDEQALRQVVTNVIVNQYTVPPIADLIRAVRGSRAIHEVKQSYNWDCSLCGQSGIVDAKEKGQKLYGTLFRCTCEFGRMKPTDYQFWNDDLTITWDLVPWAYGYTKAEKIWHKGFGPKPAQIQTLAKNLLPSMPQGWAE